LEKLSTLDTMFSLPNTTPSSAPNFNAKDTFSSSISTPKTLPPEALTN